MFHRRKKHPIKKRIFCTVAIFLLIVIIAGCKKDSTKTLSKGTASGTDGIVISFAQGNPMDSYTVGELMEPLSIIVEVRNKGSWPQTEEENIIDQGAIYLSGFDREIIQLESRLRNLNREFLQGLSLINPNGGFDTSEFKGMIRASGFIINTYNPTILATACFPYVTKASPQICLDPQPFDTKRKKVCTIGSTSLPSQGAPVAITKIDQEASSSKTQFKITIKNVGGGDVLKRGALEVCDPAGGREISRNDFDRVELIRADIGTVRLSCGPFVDGQQIRLYNGEGFIICSLDAYIYNDVKDAFTSPLNIELRYDYRKTASKPLKIQKVTGIN